MVSQKQNINKSGWQRIYPVSLAVFLVIFLYTFVRYNVYKGVDFSFIPLYITNKVLALSSVIFIGLSYILGPLSVFDKSLLETKLTLRKHFGLLGFGCASIHACISMFLLTPYYYPGLYDGGKLTLFGQLHLLFGVLAFAVFFIIAVCSIPSIAQTMNVSNWRSIQRSGYLAYILILGHVFTVGVFSWIDSRWPGNLIPISLLAFNTILFVLLVKVSSLVFTKK